MGKEQARELMEQVATNGKAHEPTPLEGNALLRLKARYADKMKEIRQNGKAQEQGQKAFEADIAPLNEEGTAINRRIEDTQNRHKQVAAELQRQNRELNEELLRIEGAIAQMEGEL